MAIARRPDTSFWQKPTGALFKSLLVPGWGQFSNKKYTKAAIFAGLEIYFAARAYHFIRETRDRFDVFQATESRQDYFAYDEVKSDRNLYYWLLAGTAFISMWDAFADAHIKPFEEAKDRGEDYWGYIDEDRPDLKPPPFSLALTIKY